MDSFQTLTKKDYIDEQWGEFKGLTQPPYDEYNFGLWLLARSAVTQAQETKEELCPETDDTVVSLAHDIVEAETDNYVTMIDEYVEKILSNS